MGVEQIPAEHRTADLFSHIDMGFLNRRLAISALGSLREDFLRLQSSGDDHMTRLRNDHLLVQMLIDVYEHVGAPTLAQALEEAKPRQVFMSTELLEPATDIYEADRVTHAVHLERAPNKPVNILYHSEHLVSSTGKMTLREGYKKGYRQSMIGLLHDRGATWEIEPIVIGAPWLDHPRNPGGDMIIWIGHDFGEILPEDIEEFSKMKDVAVTDAKEWMNVMRTVPEAHVKTAIAELLTEPVKKDWGGEENDHFSANASIAGRRRTAAFLLKGPTNFREMTPAMCGKNGDQIYRLANAGADVSVIQHSHLIGSAVRETLRAFIVRPGYHRKFCMMDGQATYRLLKAYDKLSK